MKDELENHAYASRLKQKWRKKKKVWASGHESGEWQFISPGQADQAGKTARAHALVRKHEPHETRALPEKHDPLHAMPMLRHISGLVMAYDPQLQSWIATEDSCDTWADWEMARGIVTTRKFTERLMRLSGQAAQFARRHSHQMPRDMSRKMNRETRPGS